MDRRRRIDRPVLGPGQGGDGVQTIKTAAIVVLLMTVMYGAYVSLTTPPEPLPDEVHDMLVASEDFDIDVGFLDSIDLARSSPDGDTADLSRQPDGLNGHGPAVPVPPPGPATRDTLAGVSGTLSDQGPASGSGRGTDPEGGRGTDPEGAEGNPAAGSPIADERFASRDLNMLPAVESDAVEREIDRGRDYPATGERFDLPDPEQIARDLAPPADEAEPKPASDAPAGQGMSPSEGTSPETDRGATSDPSGANRGLANAIRTADRQYYEGKKKEALATLSLFYDSPGLSDDDRTQLLSRLDPLAREVIYSEAHLLEQPHRVRQKETLVDIAAEYEVPWQLLANINGVRDPITILPGTDLKVVRGPFRAEVSLDRQELTLFLRDSYAGRFPVAIGDDPRPEPGTYTVQEKQNAKTYYDRSGNPIPPGSPNNPYGSVWIDLGGRLSIHGSPHAGKPTSAGCISLAGDHASDLLGILSDGSAVVIRR